MIEVTSKLAKMWNQLDDNDKEYWKSREVEENSKVGLSSVLFVIGLQTAVIRPQLKLMSMSLSCGG
jgi:hypothetical protein